MATKPASPNLLTGIDAILAGNPLAQTPRGGMEFSFDGSTDGGPAKNTNGDLPLGDFDENGVAPEAETTPFAGMGPLLEDDDAKVFKDVNEMVLRQEVIALNHLAQDTHWQLTKMGYPWSVLEKDPNRDSYKQSLPYGAKAISIQAVPNKAWDLINKTTESLLVDFPQSDCEPIDDSEQAQAACDLGDRFLSQEAGEQGTNHAVLFNDRVKRSLTCGTSYLECWVDPTGGGYVPLQILAHPQAVDANSPLMGPDQMPTTDPVLRYVTPAMQFTDDASQAAPQWQPKLRAAKWQREHIRVFPETKTVAEAEKVIILGYCTLGEAKRRWQSVAEMEPSELDALCDWTPPRYLVLLPPFQRARWRLTDGRDKEKAGSSDERIIFWYRVYAKASPDYKKGASVVVTGARNGLVLDRKLLAVGVEVEKDGKPEKNVRCLEIPVVQITPFGDPDDQDPSGRAFIELFAGAVENNAHLSMLFSELLGKVLRPVYFTPSTSRVAGWEMDDARATGDHVEILRPEDKPTLGELPQLPSVFFNMFELSDEAINSIASQERAAQGSENSKERSGKALQIAVARNNVNLSGPNNSINGSYQRWCRILLEQAMAEFDTPQLVSYTGEDGAFKAEEVKRADFALIGKVNIKAGTGTLQSPDDKVQYLGNLKAAGFLSQEEAQDAARESFSARLGLPPNAHEQYVERCIDAWLEGPPEGWAEADAAMQQYQQQTAPIQAQAQVASEQAAQMGAPPPEPPMLPEAPPAPWTPFMPRPNDNEPAIAGLWVYRLSKVMSTVKYSSMDPAWRALLDNAYLLFRGHLAPPPVAPPAQGAPPNEPPKKDPAKQQAPAAQGAMAA